MNTDQGVVYVVSGAKRFFDEAAFSAKTFRQFNPTVPIAFFSDWPSRARRFADFAAQVPKCDHPLKAKVAGILASPFKRTLFLDSDTQVRASLAPVFELLRTHDIAIANEVLCDWSSPPYRFIDFKNPDSFNTGVVGFGSSPTAKAFLNEWFTRTGGQDSSNMWPGHNGDQRHFNELLRSGFREKMGLKLAVLDNCIYNVRPQLLEPLRSRRELDRAAIFHFRGGESGVKRLRSRLKRAWQKVQRKVFRSA